MPTMNKIALEEHFPIPAMEGYWAPTVVHVDRFMVALPLASLPMLRLGSYVYPSTRKAGRGHVLTSAHC